MKVTNIKSQVKRADRYSIYIDGKFSFGLGQSELLSSGLVVGQELTATELKHLKQKSADEKVYDRALIYLSLRPRSEGELKTYFARKNVDQETSQKLLNLLSKSGYVDDTAFAKSWVNTRRLLKPTSARKLRLELRQKQVSSEIIDAALSEDTVDDLQVLKELVARKRKQSRYQDDLKLMQYLSRQGFNYGDIKQALNSEHKR